MGILDVEPIEWPGFQGSKLSLQKTVDAFVKGPHRREGFLVILFVRSRDDALDDFVYLEAPDGTRFACKP